VIGRDEIPGRLREIVDAVQPFELRAAYQDGLTALGLWPEGVDVLDALGGVSRDELGGFYVPSERRLYLVRGAPTPFGVAAASWLVRRDLGREMPLAHEIVHALQHEMHPELFGHDRFAVVQDDVEVGLQAAREGHATWYGLAALGVLGDPPAPESFGDAIRKDVASRREGALAEAPALLRMTMFTPYAEGYRLAAGERGALLDDPPVSSEQILHPERRREPFEAIDLAALHAALPANCRFVIENSAGELGIAILLADLAAPDRAPPASASEGWAGDRYLAARCNDRREFVWLTLWDSEADAREFESAYLLIASAVRARANLRDTPIAWREGREVRIASPALAPHAGALLAHARRARVATLDEVFAFFAEPRGERGRSSM
jgi:heme-degrading monooxygenase HmoA